MSLAGFNSIWLVDFEFISNPGERPKPICMVAREVRTGKRLRLWREELEALPGPPYSVGPDSLFVAYYASAEFGCHLALGWPLPTVVLDLFTEFRVLTNGLETVGGAGLVGALMHFGLDSLTAAEKEGMRTLILTGGPWTNEEREMILTYCESDVAALDRLLPRMLPDIDFPRAVLRGRFMKAVAKMEHVGVPIDSEQFGRLQVYWPHIKGSLVERIDSSFGVFDGDSFKAERFARWLATNGIPWPRLASGALALNDDTFREMARAYPIITPLRELRYSLSEMRLSDLAVGSDSRNRCMLSAFRARTGRNQPSNSKFIFGPAVWLRGLIRPRQGYGLAYVDWSQQEFGIAAALSGDPTMIAAYESGDPYLAFAMQAGAVPADATKKSHAAEREQFKACALAVQYGMGGDSLALRVGQPPFKGRDLLRLHHATYPRFWNWSDGAVDYAMLYGSLHTAFGWMIHVGAITNPRALRNFPMQANGAEMLRLACSYAIDRGISVCAPVHDAILIEAPLEELDGTVAIAQMAMGDASSTVLGGFRLRSEPKVVRYPDRYMDERGTRMWNTVMGVIGELELERPVRPCTGSACTSATLPVHPCTPVLSTISSSSTPLSSE